MCFWREEIVFSLFSFFHWHDAIETRTSFQTTLCTTIRLGRLKANKWNVIQNLGGKSVTMSKSRCVHEWKLYNSMIVFWAVHIIYIFLWLICEWIFVFRNRWNTSLLLISPPNHPQISLYLCCKIDAPTSLYGPCLSGVVFAHSERAQMKLMVVNELVILIQNLQHLSK